MDLYENRTGNGDTSVQPLLSSTEANQPRPIEMGLRLASNCYFLGGLFIFPRTEEGIGFNTKTKRRSIWPTLR